MFCFLYGWAGGVFIAFILNVYLLTIQWSFGSSVSNQDQLYYFFAYNLTALLMGAAFSEQKMIISKLISKSLKLKASNETNRHLTAKVIKVGEQEKKQISQELHDEIGQNLVALQLDIKMLEIKYPELHLSQDTENLKHNYNNIYKSVYEVLSWLRPRVIDDLGFYNALTGNYFKDRLSKSNIKYFTNIDKDVDKLPNEHQIAIFRIVQESVTNCLKHSKATEFNIDISVLEKIKILISDDGIDLDNEKISKMRNCGLGIEGINDRVNALGGNVSIDINNGFNITIELDEKVS
jgi:two-component system sensor histidine kinase UhpB